MEDRATYRGHLRVAYYADRALLHYHNFPLRNNVPH